MVAFLNKKWYTWTIENTPKFRALLSVVMHLLSTLLSNDWFPEQSQNGTKMVTKKV